jgi:ketosteroid isomerase-like protein
MSQENVEIVRRIYAGWGNGDLSVGVDAFDRHLVFIVSPDFPAFGVFVGLEEIRGFMRDFLEQWEQATFEAKRLQAVGDTVLAHVVQHSKGKTSGIEGDLPYFQLFTFRGKKIVRIESMIGQREALEAVGLAEQDAHADS